MNTRRNEATEKPQACVPKGLPPTRAPTRKANDGNGSPIHVTQVPKSTISVTSW